MYRTLDVNPGASDPLSALLYGAQCDPLPVDTVEGPWTTT